MGNASRCLACSTEDFATRDQLPPGVIRVDNGRLAEAVEVAARSFAGTATSEPEWSVDWTLGPHLRGKWEDARRLEFARWLQTLLLRFTLAEGGIVLATQREDGRLGAVCMNVPFLHGKQPAGELRGMLRYLWHIREIGIPPFAKRLMSDDIGKGIEKRQSAVEKSLKDMHHTHASEDHWYVQAMAVDTDAQGNGYCGKLMRLVSAFADNVSVPCYLETSGHRNVKIYERFGYCHYAMVRPAAAP
eukprot:TRINITY_DN6999_c0_g1_i1.p1 TRINITY_DN6999_c0_g1~~TRINITY_DN6999_c0_g1_i1.p1  ORF type:complete len:245 (-),score=45.82 TRINITY_DN6999_c0_g1_i1:373-1107(-)